MIAIGSPSIAESELSTMTTEPKYAVRVNDLQSPAEAEKVTKIICNGKMVQFFFSNYFALTGLGIFTLIYSGDHWNLKIQVDIQNMKQENPRQESLAIASNPVSSECFACWFLSNMSHSDLYVLPVLTFSHR